MTVYSVVIGVFAALAFFNHINVQVGAISAVCTAQSCPNMTAGKE